MTTLPCPSVLLLDTNTKTYLTPSSVIYVFEGEDVPQPSESLVDIVVHLDKQGRVQSHETRSSPLHSGSHPEINGFREENDTLTLEGTFSGPADDLSSSDIFKQYSERVGFLRAMLHKNSAVRNSKSELSPENIWKKIEEESNAIEEKYKTQTPQEICESVVRQIKKQNISEPQEKSQSKENDSSKLTNSNTASSSGHESPRLSSNYGINHTFSHPLVHPLSDSELKEISPNLEESTNFKPEDYLSHTQPSKISLASSQPGMGQFWGMQLYRDHARHPNMLSRGKMSPKSGKTDINESHTQQNLEF